MVIRAYDDCENLVWKMQASYNLFVYPVIVNLRNDTPLNILEFPMVAYEVYWRDETGKEHLIGILPERRRNPERIAKESPLNWGRKVIGDHSDVNEIYFVQVEIQGPEK